MNTEEVKKEENAQSKISRVVISKEADEALKNLLAKVRNGFSGGEIERGDVVTWLLLNHEKIVGESEIRNLRTEYFDNALALEQLAKGFKRGQPMPEDIKKVLRQIWNDSNKLKGA